MFTPRITARQLMAHYGTAERALAAGDFCTALRLADGDPELVGICRVMLGNEVAGTAALDGCAGLTPRGVLVAALGHWLLGRDGDARRRLDEAPTSRATQALEAAMTFARPRIAFFSGAEKMQRFVAEVRASGLAEIVTIGHRPDLVDVPVTPATDPASLAAAVGRVDAVYIDNLTILPPQLAAIAAPKICQFYDIEHAYAARGREVGWIDWLVASAGGEHFETCMRFGRPALLRGIGLTELWPDLSGLRRLAESLAAPKPIDVLYTGGIDMPFYPDKRIRLAALAQLDGGLQVEIHGRMLDKDEYLGKLGQAKFVFSSTRTANSTPKRLIEALARGALPLCEADSSLGLLFDCEGAVAKTYGSATLLRDVAAHVRAYDASVGRIAAERGLAERLLAHMPTSAGAVRGFVRFVTVLAAMSRAGMGWRGFIGMDERPAATSTGSPRAPYAAKHSDMQAYQPQLRRALFAPLAAGPQTPLPERMVALASLAIVDRQEHLLRRQPLGRQQARAALVAVLNRERKKAPASLTVWLQLAELLVDLGRARPAARVLAAIDAAWTSLDLDPHPTLVTPAFEYEDFGFVDGLIRDGLTALDPAVFPGPGGNARLRLQLRLLWLQARLARDCGDTAGLAAALDMLLGLAPAEPWLLEQGMLLAAAGARSEDARGFLRRLCRFYLRGMRLCPRFLALQFPLALQAMALLGRDGLARLTLRRYLRAKARVQLTAAALPVSAAERAMLDSFRPAIAAEIGALASTPLAEPLAGWFAAAAE